MLKRRALVVVIPRRLLHESIPGTRLHERDPDLGADATQLNDLVLVEEVVFENHLEDRAVGDDGRVDEGDLPLHVGPVAAQGFADVDHHVDFGGAVLGGGGGFEDFDLGGAVAGGEGDDGADLDGGAGEGGDGEGDPVGFDAGGGEVVFLGDGEAGGEVGVGHGGVEEGVVDGFGEEGDRGADGAREGDLGGHFERWVGLFESG